MAQNYILQDDGISFWPVDYLYWTENYSPLVFGLYYSEIYRISQELDTIISLSSILEMLFEDNVVLSFVFSANVILTTLITADVELLRTVTSVVTLMQYDELERTK